MTTIFLPLQTIRFFAQFSIPLGIHQSNYFHFLDNTLTGPPMSTHQPPPPSLKDSVISFSSPLFPFQGTTHVK